MEAFGPEQHRALAEGVEGVALSDISALPITPDVQLLFDRPRNDRDLDQMWIVPSRAPTVVFGVTPRLDALKLLVDQHAQLTALRGPIAKTG